MLKVAGIGSIQERLLSALGQMFSNKRTEKSKHVNLH